MKRRHFIASGITIPIVGCINDVEKVDSLPNPTLGDENATMDVEIFSDFGCPSCARFTRDILPEIYKHVETNRIKIIHYDFVLPHSELSEAGANAARLVQDNIGDKEFFEFKELVAHNHNNALQIIESLGEEVGVNGNKVSDAIDEEIYKPVIDKDTEYAQELDFTSTPTVLIDRTEVVPENLPDILE